MRIFKYVKVLILAPAIGSALIGIAGLLVFGGVLIAGHGRWENRQAGRGGQNTTPAGRLSSDLPAQSQRGSAQTVSKTVSETQPDASAQHATARDFVRLSRKEQRAGDAPKKQSEEQLNFERPIDRDQLAFLRDFAGRAADDADGKQRVRALVGMVAPYTPYHFGTDFPLPQVISTLLLNEPRPIEIRDGRYATMSGIRNATHNRAGLLWVDMREGIALGAIYFDPSNGEPTPTLTIFSRQLDCGSVRMSQLPQAFQEDLSRWVAAEGVPPILTRYFIGASGEKYVLEHDENYCERSEGVASPSPKGVCEEMNAQATLIDMAAARFMEQTHNASNATLKMIASTGQVE